MKRWTRWIVLAALVVLPGSRCLAADPAATAPSMRPERAADAKPGMRTLYLIRHGEYDSRDSADARVGKHLTALGREQAGYVAQRLNALPVKFADVRTSTLTRAMETGDIIAEVLRVPVKRDSLFNEATPPASRADIRHDTPGEADSAQSQFEAAWASYAKPSPTGDQHQIVAAHGNVIRWFVTKALGADTRQWANMEIAHCGLTIVTIKPDGAVRLLVFNDLGHLPLEKQTWAGRGPGWDVGVHSKR